MEASMNRSRFWLPLVVAALALSSSLAARAGDAAPGESSAKAETGGQDTSDSVKHSLHRAAEAAERSSKQAAAATSRGVLTAVDATKRGLDKAGKAVEHAVHKTKEALTGKDGDR
jgi:hypothetical protein